MLLLSIFYPLHVTTKLEQYYTLAVLTRSTGGRPPTSHLGSHRSRVVQSHCGRHDHETSSSETLCLLHTTGIQRYSSDYDKTLVFIIDPTDFQ
jgi:hypothetical protein